MLIISEFKDYYDNCCAQGIDKTIIYNRQNKVIDKITICGISDIVKKIPVNYFYDDRGIPFIIGWCGNIALGYNVKITLNNNHTRKRCYTTEEIYNWIKQSENSNDMKSFLQNYKSNSYFSPKFVKSYVETAFGVFNTISTPLKTIFTEYGIPCFVIYNINSDYSKKNSCTLEVNPILKNWNLQKQVDSVTMFQEISMYISGVLGTPKQEPSNINDVEMAKKKGFDKYSFRNTSPGKKLNRWK